MQAARRRAPTGSIVLGILIYFVLLRRPYANERLVSIMLHPVGPIKQRHCEPRALHLPILSVSLTEDRHDRHNIIEKAIWGLLPSTTTPKPMHTHY